MQIQNTNTYLDVDVLVANLAEFAIYEVDSSGIVRNWSAGAAKMFGYSPSEIVGRPATDLVLDPATVGFHAGVEQPELFGWAIRKDGTRFWANQVTMIPREDGMQGTVFPKIVKDVTLWRAGEDERDRLFAMSVDMICVAGFDGFFKRVNPSFFRVLGLSEADLLGKPFIDFVHPDDIASTLAETKSIVTDDHVSTKSFQNRYRCADGTYRWLEWRSQASHADQLIFAVARDVTQQKADEQKLQAYSQELERSNSALQQFAYVASHDLQEPLRAVAGCVQMLAERNAGKLDDRSVELVGYAVEGAKRMQMLINDLLAFSRVGSKGISKGSIDPRGAIDKALRQLSVAITECNAVIVIDPLPMIWADSVQLTQLFQNLIGNALKFRTEERPQVRIDAERGEGETIFSVRDNGIGIAPEYQRQLFGVFVRLNSRREYVGNGIGLAICKKIVERHDGRIWIESELGKGAAFRFSIPDEPKP